MSGIRQQLLLKTNQYNYDQYNAINIMMNMRYKMKYKRLKKMIKNCVFENAALCDQIAQIQENISIIKEERQFLLKKLMDYEDAEIQLLNTTSNNATALQQNSIPGKRGPKKRLNSDAGTKTAKANANSSNTASNKTSPSSGSSTKKQQQQQQQQQNLVTDGQGRLVFPIKLENLVIHSIGEVIPENPNFHRENWIYPVGYVATRVYAHPLEPERKCTFTCKILDNSGMPQFQIIPDSDYDHVFFGESANICHLRLLETIARASDIKNLPLRAQGEIFFGLNHKTVKSLLQSSSLANIKKCPNFKGFLPDTTYNDEDKDPTMNFDALQKLMAISVYHTVPEIKAEPPDELLE